MRDLPYLDDGIWLIPLCGRSGRARAWAKIDNDANAVIIMQHTWSFHSSGRPLSFINGKFVYMNRYICNIVNDKKLYVKHLNEDSLDHRKNNLKICEHGKYPDRAIRNNFRSYQYENMLYKQNRKCAICGLEPEKKTCTKGSGNMPVKQRALAVDHCHKTGTIRGLLCFYCNTALGNFEDNITYLDSAIKYICDNNNIKINFGPDKINRPISINNLPKNVKAIPAFDKDKNIKDYFIVDTKDYLKVIKYNWSIATTGKVVRTEKKNGKSKTIYLHRYLFGLDGNNSNWLKSRNKDMLDYRKDNFRIRDRSKGKVIQNWRDINIYRDYGIDIDIYDELEEKQNYVCAICNKVPKNGQGNKKLQIDHCHNSKVIRGLLCMNCNLGIGHFHDKPLIISKAIKYLEINMQSRL